MNISNSGNNLPDTESPLNKDEQEKDANEKFASWSIDFGRPKSACPSRFVSRPPSRLNTIYEVEAKQEKAAVKRAKKHLSHILKSEEKHEKTVQCKSFREQNEIVKKHQAEEKLNFKQIRAEMNRQYLKEEQAKKMEESSAKRTNVIVQKQQIRYDMFCVEKGSLRESESAKREREILEKVLMREASNRNKLCPFSRVFTQSTPLPAIPRATNEDRNDKNENKKKTNLLQRIRARIVGFFRRRNNRVGVMKTILAK